MKLTLALISAISLLASLANADVVVTKNGSTINGKLVAIDKGVISIETDFAGLLEIQQDQVVSFSTDEPVYVTLEDGTTYLGPVVGGDDALTVRSSSGEATTELAEVSETWQPGEDSPTTKRQAIAMEKLRRKWAYQAAFDLTGKSGNSESTGLATSFRATLKGPEDKLEFFATAHFEESENANSEPTKTADDARGVVDYSNNFGDSYNWYVRSEFGFDAIKDIEQYYTVAAGLGYVFADTERRSLDVRAGFGYLYEAYDDVPILDVNGVIIGYAPREASSSASMDFGLSHTETLKWGLIANRLTYTPTIDDFGNFRLVHDSSLEIPLKVEGWSIRTGINNRYDSEAGLSDKEELDTTYYVRMVLKWL